MKVILKLLQTLLILIGFSINNTLSWNYLNQTDWQSEFPRCKGEHQSPIDLNVSKAKIPPRPMPDLQFHNYDRSYKSVEIMNNGHTAQITVHKPSNYSWPETDEILAAISGGNLGTDVRYVIESIHFHWGNRTGFGSEHAINGERFSMEMHLVHRNSKYRTVDEASEEADGLAVLAVIFDVQPYLHSPFTGFQQLTSAMQFVEEANSGTQISNFKISNLLDTLDTHIFFTYEGSLTTPPCAEAVTWTVFSDTLGITQKQLSDFRLLFDEHHDPLVDNFRELQSPNDRIVYMRV